MKSHTGYAVIMGDRVLQIFIQDPRKEETGKRLAEITKTAAKLIGQKFQIKKITFTV